ncbi:hypothetical protein K2173_028446 [Erythroxylum novogranatense]|uniref:F-box protein n=1 Tax=Erythroxylum novogranatense TaxID=1862640 RepID=A0AAV8U4Y1_9ROSI|nr:hypothetical protein K2173_028446 [Erythroxylum novogranatense]
MSMGSFSFSDFPEDVQLSILSLLNPSDIAIFACTSKRFVSLCQDETSKLWFALCDRRWGSKTEINRWANGKISYKLMYKILNNWEHLIGFWRRCGHGQQNAVNPPSLIFFEWGSSFLSGSRVSPSHQGTYNVIKTPFLFMTISAEGQIVNYVDPDGQNDGDLIPVNVNFIGDMHFSVEENAYRNLDNDDVINESGPLNGVPETSEMYQFYANRMSPGTADRSFRRQRRGDEGRKRWETEHFLKIVDCSPTPSRPLQGLWKGLCDEMKMEFYLVVYDGIGISCRRVGDLSERLSSFSPVFWTSNHTLIEPPFSREEQNIYDSRIHILPSEIGDDLQWNGSFVDDVVSRIMYINSSYDLVIPGLEDTSANPWRVEGRIWLYKNGTFGFGFLRDNFIVDLKHIARNNCLLDTI